MTGPEQQHPPSWAGLSVTCILSIGEVGFASEHPTGEASTGETPTGQILEGRTLDGSTITERIGTQTRCFNAQGFAVQIVLDDEDFVELRKDLRCKGDLVFVVRLNAGFHDLLVRDLREPSRYMEARDVNRDPPQVQITCDDFSPSIGLYQGMPTNVGVITSG